MYHESIKSVSIAALETAIARAISELVGETHVCAIGRIELDDPNFARFDLSLRQPLSFEDTAEEIDDAQ